LFAVVIVEEKEEVEAVGGRLEAMEAEAIAEACEVNAVISTELALLLVIRKSCTLSNLQTSEAVESVEDTEPRGDLREDVSSKEVEEWVSPPLELCGLPFPVDSRSRWTESHLWFAASKLSLAAMEVGTLSLILHCCKNFSVCRVFRVRRS